MRQLSLWLPLACASLLTACSGSGQTPVTSSDITTPQADASAWIGGLAEADAGMVSGALGLSQLHIDPVTLEGTITTPRVGQTQGDLYHLSIRPFFGPKDVRLRSITRGPGDTIDVDIEFSHPYAAPADLNPPATASKRIDLHIFDVTACLLVDGTDAFFSGAEAVRLNTDVLVNADGYRDLGETIDTAALGITSADLFPYKLVGNIDTDTTPTGNYNPTANGWTGAALLAPTGYDVFPMGGVATSTFRLNPTTFGALNLTLGTVAKYMDPRSTPNPKSKRLPVAGDPTSLQYILPEAAGDLQRIEASITDTLTGGSDGEIADLELTILDWDHTAIVATTFPNNANLNEISENSDIETVEVSVPDLYATNFFSGGAISGTGPEWNVTVPIVNVDLFDPTSTTEVLALIRISDTQDADNGADTTIPVALDETLAPVTALPSTRYQLARITVEPGATPPTCPDYGAVTWPLLPVVGIPFNLDLDSAPTQAFDADGINLYEIDYNNDGVYDSATNTTNGTELPDFAQAFTFTTPGPQLMKLRITDASLAAAQVVCDLNATVEAQVVATPDPLPLIGGINADMVNQTCTVTVTDNPDILWAKPTGQVYLVLRRSTAPANWLVYKSNDNAVTWGTPNIVTTPFPSPLNADLSSTRGFGLGIMSDGRVCFAGMDAGNDLTFKRSASEAGTTMDWGPGTEGSQIEIAADWYTPSVMPHPSNLNRVYILAKNNSGTLGANPFSSTLWVSNDAASPNPTFVQAGVMDVDGSTTNEYDPHAVIDSQGNVHAAWCSSNTAGSAKYRKWNDATQSWDPEVVLAQAGVDITAADDTIIKLNAADEPAVLVTNALTGTNGPLMLTKYNSGSGWTKLRMVNRTTYPNTTSDLRKYGGIAFDGMSRIHTVWREEGDLDNAYSTACAVFSPDGRRKVTDDFYMFQGTTTVIYFTNPRIEYLPGTNKMLVVAYANGSVTDGKVRFRTYGGF